MKFLLLNALNAYLPHSFLSATAASGFGLTIFLFLTCVLTVRVFSLLYLGWKTQNERKSAPAPQAENEEKAPEPKKAEREPIYYIVERKRTRPKREYGEPKEFRFK